MSIWTSPGGTAWAGGGGMGGAMAPCRLLSHWDPHSAWWPTQPTELGAQPSNASSPVQSMVLWSQRAPRLAGATCDQGHHPSAARPQITSPGRRQARRGAGSVQLEPGAQVWGGSRIPNNGHTTGPSLRPLGTFTRETLLHLRVARRGPEGHLNQEEVIQVFLHLPSGSFLINHQGSCLVMPTIVGQSPTDFKLAAGERGRELEEEGWRTIVTTFPWGGHGPQCHLQTLSPSPC